MHVPVSVRPLLHCDSAYKMYYVYVFLHDWMFCVSMLEQQKTKRRSVQRFLCINLFKLMILHDSHTDFLLELHIVVIQTFVRNNCNCKVGMVSFEANISALLS